ncbi:MAG: Gfo/Idh/MocA family protein [Acidobacteriota bacterium]|jgi:predicted dehydrogenase
MMMIPGIDRRSFVLSSTAALAADGPVRGAIIGAGGRGRYLTGEFKEIGVQMAAVCDVYEPNLQAGLAVASSGATPYSDYKKLLDDKSIQVVIVATPDHWHAQMVIDAVHAGKDVYVEKPLAHTIAEGDRILAAVRQTRRIVQVGMQRRSSELFQDAYRQFKAGDLGDVRLINSWWYNHQASIRNEPLKGKLDWKQWLGNAPARPEDAQRFFNWYYYWDYSGGLMVGQAAHMLDVFHWFMGSAHPIAVTTAGGQANLPGVEVPETTTICLEYPENYFAVFTVGYKAMRYAPVNDQLAQFHGSKARFDVGRESYSLIREDPKAVDLKPSLEKRLPGSFGPATRAHIRNFLECVKTRQQPNAPVEAAQATNIALCMAMESLRKGRRIRFNPARRETEA